MRKFFKKPRDAICWYMVISYILSISGGLINFAVQLSINKSVIDKSWEPVGGFVHFTFKCLAETFSVLLPEMFKETHENIYREFIDIINRINPPT